MVSVLAQACTVDNVTLPSSRILSRARGQLNPGLKGCGWGEKDNIHVRCLIYIRPIICACHSTVELPLSSAATLRCYWSNWRFGGGMKVNAWPWLDKNHVGHASSGLTKFTSWPGSLRSVCGFWSETADQGKWKKTYLNFWFRCLFFSLIRELRRCLLLCVANINTSLLPPVTVEHYCLWINAGFLISL